MSDYADVSGEIQAHLMAAMRLSIETNGNVTGNYAIIAQATLAEDGTFLVNWQRYGPGMP